MPIGAMGCTITMPMMTRFQSVRVRRNRGAPVVPASLLKTYLLIYGTTLALAPVAFNFASNGEIDVHRILNRFNASNFARTSEAVQAQNVAAAEKRKPSFSHYFGRPYRRIGPLYFNRFNRTVSFGLLPPIPATLE